MVRTAYIGMGGNVGDRERTLRDALARMDALEGVRVRRVSSMINTAPVGGPPGQNDYLNAVAEIETDLSPEALREALRSVEAALGRDRPRETRWGSRTCDLDILLVGDVVMDTDELTIPHARMHQRFFVLRPLAEVAPDVVHPVLHRTIADLLADLERTGEPPLDEEPLPDEEPPADEEPAP